MGLGYCHKCLNLTPLCICGRPDETLRIAQEEETARQQHDRMMEAWRRNALIGAMQEHTDAINRVLKDRSSEIEALNATIAQFEREREYLARQVRNQAGLPPWVKRDKRVPDTMGWRVWLWMAKKQVLKSPHRNTQWKSAMLEATNWDNNDQIRLFGGIHARLVPKHWKLIGWPDGDSADVDDSPNRVTGLVERFGKYVLGTNGWRAEQVVIRELMAPSTKVGLQLEQAYPDVIVHYPDQEEDKSWTSAKPSKSGKGKRHRLPSRSTRSTVRHPAKLPLKYQPQKLSQLLALPKKYPPDDGS